MAAAAPFLRRTPGRVMLPLEVMTMISMSEGSCAGLPEALPGLLLPELLRLGSPLLLPPPPPLPLPGAWLV